VRVLAYLELAGPLARSGIATTADRQRRAVARAAPEIDLLATPWRGGTPVRAAATGLAGGRAIRRFDLAHCHLFGPGTLAVVRAARRRGVPVVLSGHVTSENFADSFRGSTALAPALRRYLRAVYSRVDLVLAPTPFARRQLEAYPVTAPVRAVSNGVDRDALAGGAGLRDRYRDRFDLSGTVVFTLGNVFERKGLDTFLGLARDLRDADREYEFVWFGPYDTGPAASPAVRAAVARPPPNVTFTGWIDDRRGAFAAGDVFLFPTREETMGVAALEALASGVPAVMRDVPPLSELYADGEDCLLRSTRRGMRLAIEEVAADPTLAARLADGGRATARRHGLDRVGEALARIYRTVAAGDAAAATGTYGGGGGDGGWTED